MKALAPVVPTQVSAGIGNLRVVAFSGLRGEQHWVHMEIFEGSYGGRHGADGMDAVDTLYANTRNNPIEDIESHLPLRVERYELREDACAAGQWRGGLGAIREFTYLDDGGASVEGEGHKFAPWGFAGGQAGFPAELVVRPRGRWRRELAVQGPVHAGSCRRPLHHGRAERRRLRRSHHARARARAPGRVRRLHLGRDGGPGLRSGDHRRPRRRPRGHRAGPHRLLER
jgi:N-methylhydantoinase B/oxoprolinase/acetone carboxylase alpha subunit